MSRQTSTSPVSGRRRDTSNIRQNTPPSLNAAVHHPNLGGVAAICLFAVILVAFVVQSAVTQHVQTTLHFRQPFLLFYIAHSSFTLIFPLHLTYLACTTSHSPKYYTNLAIATLRSQTSLPSSRTSAFPTKRVITTIFLLTVGMSLPGLLWYIAVSLASISDVTAIWNTSAFWAYLLSVYLLYTPTESTHSHLETGASEQMQSQHAWWNRLEPRKLLAVAMACIGVGVVVYSGTDDKKESEATAKPAVDAPSAPLAGDLLTLMASFLYAAVQVMYKKYIALPNEPTEADAVASSPLATYRPLAATDDHDEDEEEDAILPSQEGEEEELMSNDTIPVERIVHVLPFGLYPNFITSLVGITTLFVAWPLPLLFSTPSAQNAVTSSPSMSLGLQITLSIVAIALAGLTWNAGYLILLGIWGPVITSVGNLLTIVLMLIVESVFVASAPSPSLAGVLGCGMIAGGFAVLVWEVVGPGRQR